MPLPAASPDATAGQTLEQLAKEMSRLISYTTELSTARDAAVASQQTAAAMMALVTQLGELQRAQLSANERMLSSQQQELARLADTWTTQWREEVRKSLAAIEGAAQNLDTAAEAPQRAMALLKGTVVHLGQQHTQHLEKMFKQQAAALTTQGATLEKQLAEGLAPLIEKHEELDRRIRAVSSELENATDTQRAAVERMVDVAQRFEHLGAEVPDLIAKVEQSGTSRALSQLAMDLAKTHSGLERLAGTTTALEETALQLHSQNASLADQLGSQVAKVVDGQSEVRGAIGTLRIDLSGLANALASQVSSIEATTRQVVLEFGIPLHAADQRQDTLVRQVGKLIQALVERELPGLRKEQELLFGRTEATLSAARAEQGAIHAVLARHDQMLAEQHRLLTEHRQLLEAIAKKKGFLF